MTPALLSLQQALSSLVDKSSASRTSIHLQAALDLIAAKEVLERLLANNPDDAEAIQALAKLDHTAPRYKWLECIYALYKNVRAKSGAVGYHWESMNKVKELVHGFDEWKDVIGDGVGREVNICDYKNDPDTLGSILEEAELSNLEPRVLLYRSDMEVIPFQSPEYSNMYRIVRVDNHAALCFVGRSGTSWCSAQRYGKHYWRQNKKLFGGNTVYVIQSVDPTASDDDPNKYRPLYLVRVSNDGYVGVIRRHDDDPVMPNDSDFGIVEELLRDAKIAPAIDLDRYDPMAGGGGGADEFPNVDLNYGQYVEWANGLREFGFRTGKQWHDMLESIKPRRIVAADVARVWGLLPGAYHYLLSNNDQQNRALFVNLVLNYASSNKYKKTRRTFRRIASRLVPENLQFGGRLAAVRLIWFASEVLHVVDADRLIDIFNDPCLVSIAGKQPAFYVTSDIYVKNIDHTEFILQHCREFEGLGGLDTLIKYSRYLRWPERQPADPASEIHMLQRLSPHLGMAVVIHLLGTVPRLSWDAEWLLMEHGVELVRMGRERLRAFLADESMMVTLGTSWSENAINNVVRFYEPLRDILARHFGDGVDWYSDYNNVVFTVLMRARLANMDDVHTLGRVLDMIDPDVVKNVFSAPFAVYGINVRELERCLSRYLRSQGIPVLDMEHKDEFLEYVEEHL